MLATPVSEPRPLVLTGGAGLMLHAVPSHACGPVSFPSPSWPPPLPPQQLTWPEPSTAQKLEKSVASLTTPASTPVPCTPVTATGTKLSPPGGIVPAPSCPSLSFPQQSTEPEVSKAHMVRSSPDRPLTPPRVPVPPSPTTATGVALACTLSPAPSTPLEPTPQQSTAPEVSRAQMVSPWASRLATPPSVPVPPMPSTATRTLLDELVPLPRTAMGPPPQQSTRRDVRIAHIVVPSPTTLATPPSFPAPPTPLTGSGTAVNVSLEPVPKPPYSALLPQQSTPPVLSSA